MATKTPEPDNATAAKKSKPRSPNYPAISLVEAIERTRKIYKADGRAGAPVAAAVKHVGYSGPHGKALTVLSALGKFGLTENKAGRVVPTQAAVDILEFDSNHERHKKALREAVLMPAAYRNIIERYRKVGVLPSDESLKPELVADLKFSPSAAGGFIKDFRTSLEFAGLLVGNELKLSIEGNGGAGVGDELEFDMADTAENRGNQTGGTLPLVPPKLGVKQDRMTLGDCQVLVQRPEPLTQEVYNDLKSMFSLVLRNARRAIPGGGSET